MQTEIAVLVHAWRALALDYERGLVSRDRVTGGVFTGASKTLRLCAEQLEALACHVQRLEAIAQEARGDG